METAAQIRKRLDAVWRIESARIIAGVARVVRDVGVAEELAQGAIIAALESWPTAGVPDNPGAWLMQTAKNRAIDHVRRDVMRSRTHDEIEQTAGASTIVPAGPRRADGDQLDDVVGDDVLRLVFVACHPVLSAEARTALTLRMIGGLTVEEIARAFLVAPPTIAQRIVRAKRALADAHVPFELPGPEDIGARLASVLEVIYFIFNEGYSATAGDDWMRPDLCEDALRLVRRLAGLVPNESEVQGLAALLEIQASRTDARSSATGAPILLLDQDRARWNQVLIRRGLAALERAESLARQRAVKPGAYALQAAIAACHARARVASDTEWPRIAALYDALAELTQSPVVDLNRAVAYGMAFGPAQGLVIVDALVEEGALAQYHLLPSVRADLLIRLGRVAEARAELAKAASWATNARERELLLARARALSAH